MQLFEIECTQGISSAVWVIEVYARTYRDAVERLRRYGWTC